MDAKDRKILELLQQNALYTAAELADAVGLTTTPCWRRVQKLEEQGYIRGRVALLDRELMNVGVTVFVSVRTGQHSREWLERFIRSVNDTPEIVEAYRLSGDTDYLLRIVVPSIQEYDRLYQRLIKELEFLDVSSSFAMQELKSTTAIPVTHA
ncbi:MAG: Lrp/AsnC family transcriptional regulator [Gammaproteobacteria bacterium]|jgi:Lrp/AsnC family transcriptional regulator|nr:Lrp/AsnC family transcriptional regulator [Gammaproteobacteria bacterium]